MSPVELFRLARARSKSDWIFLKAAISSTCCLTHSSPPPKLCSGISFPSFLFFLFKICHFLKDLFFIISLCFSSALSSNLLTASFSACTRASISMSRALSITLVNFFFICNSFNLALCQIFLKSSLRFSSTRSSISCMSFLESI